jgi:hypothetical protein
MEFNIRKKLNSYTVEITLYDWFDDFTVIGFMNN